MNQKVPGASRTLPRRSTRRVLQLRLTSGLVPKKTATALEFALVMTVSARKLPDLYERVVSEARFAVLTPLAVPVPVPTA